MKNLSIMELTNKYIDNELTKGEELQLKELLTDKENKAYFESFTAIIKKVEENKSVEQEINIRGSVMSSIQKQSGQNVLTKLIGSFSQVFNGHKIGYAFSFGLGGLVIGLIFFIQSANSPVDDLFTKGVMSNSNFDETYFLQEYSLEGAIKVKQSQGIIIMDVYLKTSEMTDCELKYNSNELTLYGVKSVEPNYGGKFMSGAGSIRLSNLESNHYLVFLRSLKSDESKVYASFYRGSMTIANLTIDIKN